MSDEQFREALQRAVPLQEVRGGIVQGAKQRRRRRRTGAGIAVALVSVAVVVPLGLQGFGGDDALLATPSPSGSVAPPSPSESGIAPSASTSPTSLPEDGAGLAPQVCADLQSGRLTPEELPASSDLKTGAVRAWLCGYELLGPREPLETNPDKVVQAINVLEPPPGWTQDMACTLVGGGNYNVVLDYPNGERKSISVETNNCQWVGGWGQRTGGAELMAQLLPLWEQQRETLEPFEGKPAVCDGYPRVPEGLSSYARSSFLPVEHQDLVRGAVCGLSSEATSFDGKVIQRWLPDHLVNRIAQSATLSEGIGSAIVPGLPYMILLNKFGDPVTWGMGPGGSIQGINLPSELTTELTAALDDIRLTPFRVQPSECGKWNPDGSPARLTEVVGGFACIGNFTIPELGPELPPDLAIEIAKRFEAEAAPPTTNYGGFSGTGLTLFDSQRRYVNLVVTSDGKALIPDDTRWMVVWPVPEDIKAKLERYGLTFGSGD